MGFQFNRDGALKAGASDFISESGVYFGKFTKCYETKYDSGSVKVNFEFVTNEGQKSDYLNLVTVKKDGSQAFGVNHIWALMGILKIANAEPVQIDPEHKGYPMFCNKPIGIILQKENKDGGKFQMNILHFIDPITKKTFTEHANNEEAKEYTKPIADKGAKTQKNDTSFGFGANVKETSPAEMDAMFGTNQQSNSDLPWENK